MRAQQIGFSENKGKNKEKAPKSSDFGAFCIPENHALDAWFKRAFGDEGDKKTPFALE